MVEAPVARQAALLLHPQKRARVRSARRQVSLAVAIVLLKEDRATKDVLCK